MSSARLGAGLLLLAACATPTTQNRMQSYRRVVVPPVQTTVAGKWRGLSEYVATRIREEVLASLRDSDRWAVATDVGTDASGTLLLKIEVTGVDESRGWTRDPAQPKYGIPATSRPWGHRSVDFRYEIRDAVTAKAILPVQEVWSSGGGGRSDSGPRHWDWTAAFLAQSICADLGVPIPGQTAKNPQ